MPGAAALVPVAVFPEPTAEAVPAESTIAPKPGPGRIEIMLSGGVRVRIEGAVDPAAVTAAMTAVMKARRRR